MTIDSIALTSIQSEITHLSSLPLFTDGKLLSKLLFIILFSYHIFRFTKYFNEALIISKNQAHLWYLNLIDYTVILLYLFMLYKLDNNYLLFIFSIVSGLFSFFFIYYEHGKTKNFSSNLFPDIFIIVCLVLLFIFEQNNKIRFFALRDLTYHILKFFFFY